MSRTALDWLLVAIAIGAWVFAMGKAGESDLEAAQITAQQVREITEHRELRPCDYTFVQYGPYHEKRAPECVDVKAGPLPEHLLTMPCDFDGKAGRCRR